MRNFECFRQVVAKGHALKSEDKMPVLSEELLDGLTLFCRRWERIKHKNEDGRNIHMTQYIVRLQTLSQGCLWQLQLKVMLGGA